MSSETLIRTASPARLKPGVQLDHITAPEDTRHGDQGPAAVTGRALIVWDPKHPGRKLDAIDTDQITPSAYCVSESLDSLDAKWKEGAFKYLIPDFRERVHRGETFLIAGDRFAIVRQGGCRLAAPRQRNIRRTPAAMRPRMG